MELQHHEFLSNRPAYQLSPYAPAYWRVQGTTTKVVLGRETLAVIVRCELFVSWHSQEIAPYHEDHEVRFVHTSLHMDDEEIREVWQERAIEEMARYLAKECPEPKSLWHKFKDMWM